MKFRPCIDLHQGQVKQIVGSTLTDTAHNLSTNFTSEQPSSFYAEMYRQDALTGGHIIKLGPGCDQAAIEALQAYPGGMQIGGGITGDNARFWLDQGASHVIVTSYVFRDGKVLEAHLDELLDKVGRDRLVLDLSCRKRGDSYYIVTDRWQKFTEMIISPETLAYCAKFCAEFLVHAVDVEGKCAGIAEDLVVDLGSWSPIPATYAGGVKNLDDLYRVKVLGKGRLDVTVGSALDIFGGQGIAYHDAVLFNREQGLP
ncbi:MAG: phosphoribosylformimino-5-aminoimidazole carboxamide ribotide isomerase [Proteobacteria bacterium]|nr:phosphoribosylformimino-5-aminoimidazole carboxamide ribotide isomerase [Desulfobulbaceae bacterium]MBU4152727.1 phosphoribosylformimino-5-aminoimidazole carboxamide ribotide isomerase [Pseudomonadota bacterium]MDP2104935.1 phosphoribosylformimino-5-aminoimidazole carboxamide ribotide isomerase [Desulfobulbaceae bacterium]